MATPMMRQYLGAKAEHPDCLVFMRMGDFYEIFLDDAKEAARILGVTLTSRNKDDPQPIAMAGVPWHSLEGHLPKLLAAGRKVAIMDQLEDPAQAKGLVERGLTRIITPGTLLDEQALGETAANLLVAITALDGLIGVAAIDCSTGHFQVEEADGSRELGHVLARLAPVELVLPEILTQEEDLAEHLGRLGDGPPPPIGALPAYAWRGADNRHWLHERLHVTSLEGYGIGADEDHLCAAAGAVLRYSEQQALRPLNHITSLTRLHRGAYLIIDGACRRNLEILRNQQDQTRRHSLLAAVDRTRTAPGARLLGEWLARPLAQVTAISARHGAVTALVENDALRDDLREALSEVYDLERLLTRVATERCHGRDLVHLAATLRAAGAIQGRLRNGPDLPPLLATWAEDLDPCPQMVERIIATLVDEPPLHIGEGGMIRDGIDSDLDELRHLRTGAHQWLADYQRQEAERSGIPRIKVGYNKVFGYYLEVTKTHDTRIPDHFIRKQTLVNAERYITPELKEFEEKALGAEERIRTIEGRIFRSLREATQEHIARIQHCARSLAAIDVTAGLAQTARLRGWVRPQIDDSLALELDQARHPVVEEVLGEGAFVANDTLLDAEPGRETDGPGRLAVITGPNMSGKSTYIRQVALAVILAQAGSFVPARQARIGTVDRLFTRVGAGDELARNMSTFMVEMAETANILNHASRRSLVILDEVGRGTSTFDGVSLAWAITEHLHARIGCRCLFATHYHELIDLATDRPGIRNLTVAVAEEDDDVTFLHAIVPGAATRSYGIHVARLAGVPPSVVRRASEVLDTLEKLNVDLTARERPRARSRAAEPVQHMLFTPEQSPTLQRLRGLDPDALSPRQALDLLYELRSSADRES